MSHPHFLDDGKIELFVTGLRAWETKRQELAKDIETEANTTIKPIALPPP